MDKPIYTTDQIVHQLQTQWSAGTTTYRTWDKPIVRYFIGSSQLVGDGTTGESKGWVAMDADETNAATSAFAVWNELISNLLIVPDATASDADITLAYSSTTTAGGTYTKETLGANTSIGAADPSYPLKTASIWLSSGWPTLQGVLAGTGYGFTTLLHEIGHALDLSHPGPYNDTDVPKPTYDADAVFAQDTRQYTIMSYFGGETADAGWSLTDGSFYPSTPMVYDIAAIQQKYGADYDTRNTDTTYGYHSTAGWDFFDFSKNADPVFTIWDGGGNDTIDASGYNQAQSIDLTPGAYSSVMGLTDNIAVALGSGLGVPGGPGNDLIENAIGGGGNDTLTGNYGNNLLVGNDGDDMLYGMTGADTLQGGAGDDLLDGGGTGNGDYASLVDLLTGGPGHDTFVYKPGYHATTISDFSVADDRLDLTAETIVHDLASLLSHATQDGADLVFDFGRSFGVRDVLRLQNVTRAAFSAIDPLSVAVTASATIAITPNPSDNLSTMYVSVAPLAGGGFLATRFSYVDYVNNQVLAFRYDAAGTVIDSVQVNTGPSTVTMVRAIGLGSGLTVVVWDSPNGGPGGHHAILARLLDQTGTPIGDQFMVNHAQFASSTESFDISLIASPSGGVDVEYYAPSGLFINDVPQYTGYRAGIHADGSLGDEDILGSGYRGTFSSNVNYSYGFKDYIYFVSVGADNLQHAYYQKVDGGTRVQIDDNDFFPDGVGFEQPPFQVTELTDGRIMFSYLTGYISGYSQVVTGDKVLILGTDGVGFTRPGTAGDDYLQGGAGADQLYGRGGNDVLQGLGGGDLLDGGAGTDTAAYTRSPAGVTVDLRITGPQGGGGDGAGDTLVSIENLIGGAFDDVLTGDAGPNRIEGGAGNDTIIGGGGADMLFGGSGNDTIILTADVPSGGPVAEAHGGDGDDAITINGDNAVAYGDNGNDAITINGNHNTAYAGTGSSTESAIDAVGNLRNRITVSGNDNIVYGGNASTGLTVASGDGNTLYGGPSRDFFHGGPGNDTFVGGGGLDIYNPSGGNDVYVGAAGDTLQYSDPFSDFSFAYDPATDTLIISDTRPDAPKGIATVTGIDHFYFGSQSYTLTQLQAIATVPSVSGKLVDGYVAGATVFIDANGNGVQDPGEASTVTDALGHFALPASLHHLVATGGTDIATGLALSIPLTAPAGYAAITALSTLVDALKDDTPLQTVLAALNIDLRTDLSTADPIVDSGIAEINPGDPGFHALFVTDTMLMNVFVAASAFVGSVRGITMPAAFGYVLDAFQYELDQMGLQPYLGSADDLTTLLTRALDGTGVDPASITDVATAIAAANVAADARSTLSGTDLLRAETAVAMTAQGDLADSLAEAGSPAEYHEASLAYTGANLDAAIAANLDHVGNVDGSPCYASFTLIATDRGEVPAGALAIGDRVITRGGRARPIRWIGRRSYAGRFLRGNPGVQPIRFGPGSLGDGLPRRPLFVSPNHAMFLDGVLVPARHLVNGVTIARDDTVAQVEYVHVELDEHDVLLAEGAESESFLDDRSRLLFHNAAEYTALYADGPDRGGYCAPRIEDGPVLHAIRRRLDGAVSASCRRA